MAGMVPPQFSEAQAALGTPGEPPLCGGYTHTGILGQGPVTS